MAFSTPTLKADRSSLQIQQLSEIGNGSFHLKPLAKLIPA